MVEKYYEELDELEDSELPEMGEEEFLMSKNPGEEEKELEPGLEE